MRHIVKSANVGNIGFTVIVLGNKSLCLRHATRQNIIQRGTPGGITNTSLAAVSKKIVFDIVTSRTFGYHIDFVKLMRMHSILIIDMQIRVNVIEFALKKLPRKKFVSVRVELDKTPKVSFGDERRFSCKPNFYESRKLQIRLILPETRSVSNYDRTLSLLYPQTSHGLYGTAKTEFAVTVGERIGVVKRAYAEITCPTLAYPIMAPITFIG